MASRSRVLAGLGVALAGSVALLAPAGPGSAQESPPTTFPWCAPWAAELPELPDWLPPCQGKPPASATSGGSGDGGAPAPKPVDPEYPTRLPPPPREGWPVRPIVFPVVGPVTYYNDYGDCRDACRRYHIGNDLIGVRMQPLVAAADGWITHLVPNHKTAGWGLVITDLDGWDYRYYHVNNDTPGTDDGSDPVPWRYAPGIELGAPVRAGQLVGYMGDSGNSEFSVPHVHFEIHIPDGRPINPYESLVVAERAAQCSWIPGLAQLPNFLPPTDSDDPVVEVRTKTDRGSITVSANGTVFLRGDAKSVGRPSVRDAASCPAPRPATAQHYLAD